MDEATEIVSLTGMPRSWNLSVKGSVKRFDLVIHGAITLISIEYCFSGSRRLRMSLMTCIFISLDLCRLHDQDQRISVGINDCILTSDLSIINEGIPRGYIDYMRAQLLHSQLKGSLKYVTLYIYS
jgi:hypothetical protein